MSRDYHKQGQHDQQKSRRDSNWDIVRSGGSSPHYNPPKGRSNHSTYKSGWNNAKKNS